MRLRPLSAALLLALPFNSCFALFAGNNWFPGYMPRVSATGWVSTEQNVLQGDAMAALFGNDQNILWGDVQGKNALDSSWAGNLGLGYRSASNSERVLGAYLFLDSSHALNGGHQFWDLSPGVESMGRLWDFRINGYFPVSNKNPLVQEGFADNFNQYQFIVFSGHNQYDRLVDLYQAVGNGVDGEIGRLIIPGLTAYVGGYYFAAGSSSSGALVNPQNVKGFSGRAQYEFNPHVALEFADTYDNVLHDTVLGGIRFTIGGMNNSSQDRSDITSRLLDPVERELATQSQGVAIPVQNQLQLGSGLLLEKGNIWFFAPGGSPSPQAGAVTVNGSSCTFEHPCSPAAFTQDNVDAINTMAPGANFYFAPATYDNFGDQITINGGQSLFGRTPDFTEAAQGNGRPLFLGGMRLLQGSNLIDSIRLLDSVTDGTGVGANVTALDIENASNVELSNDDINATATEAGDLTSNNTATAIFAINSQISIINSSIEASAIVTGNNLFFNFATGIGNSLGEFVTGDSFSQNHIAIRDSSVSATASIGGDSNFGNFAAGIGLNAGFGATENVNDNVITLTNSFVTAVANMGGSNNQLNFAAGIGYNAYGSGGSFDGNSITIQNSAISATASVDADNNANNFVTGIGNNHLNEGSNPFSNNQFSISNSYISATASVVGSNGSFNFANGIGNNNISMTNSPEFSNNVFAINDSSISGTASVGGDNSGDLNSANGIGANANNQSAIFIGNTLNISGSVISGAARISGDNNGTNNAVGVGGNGNDVGNGTFIDNTININSSVVAASAYVGGNNDNINQAIGILMNNTFGDPLQGNTVHVNNSAINVSAFNSSGNDAVAIGAEANGMNDKIYISNSTVNVTT